MLVGLALTTFPTRMSWCSLQPITGVFINLALMVKPYRHHATLSICRAWLVAVHTQVMPWFLAHKSLQNCNCKHGNWLNDHNRSRMFCPKSSLALTLSVLSVRYAGLNFCTEPSRWGQLLRMFISACFGHTPEFSRC
jgi:hypothetical protein